MGGLTAYYFDTYALLELIIGNPNYSRFKQNTKLITLRMNLMEMYYILLRLGRQEEADIYYDSFLEYTVLFSDETLKEAMKFRLKFKSKKFSYVDCLGYTIAKKHGVRFLTGDSQFKDMPDVEFVR